MKVLITGANGLLGSKLTQLLCTLQEVDLLATSKGACRAESGDYSYQAIDITSQSKVMEVVGSFRPDVIIHAAAMTQVDYCELHHEACDLVNIEGTRHIIEAAQAVNAFLIFVSTDFIFNGEDGPYDEQAQADPVNYYGQSKWHAEQLVQDSGVQWAIVRTVLVYGYEPGLSRTNIVLWVKESLEAGKTIQVVADQWRSPTLAEDLAMGCWLVAKNKAGGIWNISGGEFMSPYQMALEVAAFFKLNASLITKVDSNTFSQPAKRPPKTGFVITKAQKELGYTPRTFTEGLALIKGLLAPH